jgi:uncharacterized protein
MAIFAIGDLHLSFSSDKPMDVFGENWENHHEKIRENWIRTVGEEDTVLVTGDVSWALKLEEAVDDLAWVSCLPGRKIICKGNHDYWWPSMKKLKSRFPDLMFLYNNYHVSEGTAICGSRGWVCPQGEITDELRLTDDFKIYQRELARFESSISMAVKDGYSDIIAMLHYPPTNDSKDVSGFVEIIERYGIKQVVYGHLHTELSFGSSVRGSFRGVDYYLTACDYVDFTPVRLR